MQRLSRLAYLLFPAIVFAAPDCLGQTVRVDITPGHVANSFIPTEALGAGIDRINSAATDKLFAEPVMKQVLSAGWQTVSYRQNTELAIQAWHWNPQGHMERPIGQRLLRGQCDARRSHSSLLRLFPSPSRLHPQRRSRGQWLFAHDRWRREIILEEQSLPDQSFHRRAGFRPSSMGGY